MFTDRAKGKFLVVRSFTTRSLLPGKSLLDKDASLVVRPDVSFCVTRARSSDEYYELAWCYPSEIALFGSIVIGARPEYGKAFLFPVRWPLYIDDLGQDLSDEVYLDKIAGEIKADIASKLGTSRQPNPWEELPPVFIRTEYQLNSHLRLHEGYQRLLRSKIDCEDDLMVRGIAHLLKSGMLTQMGRMFYDTACLELYVSLEATLHIILNQLRKAGMKNPGNKDASSYLAEKFGEERGPDRYFGEFYDDRIKALHPLSRFGTAKFVPLYVDDLFMLYNALLRTYEFLITGTPLYFRQFEDKT